MKFSKHSKVKHVDDLDSKHFVFNRASVKAYLASLIVVSNNFNIKKRKMKEIKHLRLEILDATKDFRPAQTNRVIAVTEDGEEFLMPGSCSEARLEGKCGEVARLMLRYLNFEVKTVHKPVDYQVMINKKQPELENPELPGNDGLAEGAEHGTLQ